MKTLLFILMLGFLFGCSSSNKPLSVRSGESGYPENSDHVTSSPSPTPSPIAAPKVTIDSFSANGQQGSLSIPVNDTVILNWTTSNASLCKLTAPNGSILSYALLHTGLLTLPISVSTYFSLECSNSTSTTNSTITVNLLTAPPVLIYADGIQYEKSIAYNGSAIISWNSQGATSVINCTVTKSEVPGVFVPFSSGTYSPGISTGNLVKTTKYLFNCTNTSSGLSAFATVTVNVPAAPIVSGSITLNNSNTLDMPYNTEAVLRWSTNNVLSCKVQSPVGTTISTNLNELSGNFKTGLLTYSKVYFLICVGVDGVESIISSATANVGPTATLTATAGTSAVPLAYNTSTTLNWSSQNAASCTLSSPSNSNISNVLSATAFPTGNIIVTTIFTLSCSSSDGTIVATSITVYVAPQGQWVNNDSKLNSKNCSTVCSELGKSNVASPEGMLCASGENVPASGVGIINFNHGGPYQVFTIGNAVFVAPFYCYRTPQTRDNDTSDFTVACFCQ